MDYIYEESQKPKIKVLRQASLNSVNNHSNSKISKINSFIRPGLKSDFKNSKVSVVFKDSQINEQLQQEIHAILLSIKNYQPFLKHIKQKQQQQTIRQQILSLDQIINFKDNEIKIITEEVKHLKSTSNPAWTKNNNKNSSREEQNNIYNYHIIKNPHQDSQENNIFKLADELKQQRQFLLKLQNQHSTKQSNLRQIRQKVEQIEQKYVEKCLKTKQRPLRYEEFKQLNQEKKKQMKQKVNKRAQKTTVRQKHNSIKQMPEFVFNSEPIKAERDVNTTITKKSLKSLQNRKIIAQQALKNARKKHNNELSEFMAKLQFLRDEDSLLYEKIREKEEQRIMLQAKFNEQRGAGSFHLHGHNRLMSPGNHSSRGNNLNRLDGSNLNTKINRLMTPMTPISNDKSVDRYQHHFSPHRKLISSRKATQDTNRSSRELSKKFKFQQSNDKKVSYQDDEMVRFDDYGERMVNKKSKNSISNQGPSTNQNDSQFDRINN